MDADVFTDLTNTLNALSVVEEHHPNGDAPPPSTPDLVMVEEDELNRDGLCPDNDGEGTVLMSWLMARGKVTYNRTAVVAMEIKSPPRSWSPLPPDMEDVPQQSTTRSATPVLNDATQLLAERLAEQLLKHHGCLENPGLPPSGTNPDTVALSELIYQECPDVLSRPDIQPHLAADWEKHLPIAARRQLLKGPPRRQICHYRRWKTSLPPD